MSQTSAISSGPISYFTSDGHRLIIPIGLIAFNNGVVSIVGGDPTYDKPEIKAWLERLHRAGILRESAAPAAQPAFNAASANPGAWGNDTVITIARPSATAFDMTVTVTNVYKGLTTSTLKGVVGASATTGSRPGLVYVSSVGTPSMPSAAALTSLTGGATGTPNVAAFINVNPSTAFTLTARTAGPSGNKLKMSIGDVDALQGTFTLTVVWQDSLTNQSVADAAAITSSMSTVATTFSHVLTFSTPVGGYAAPSAGTYVLKGGLDVATAAGIVFSKS